MIENVQGSVEAPFYNYFDLLPTKRKAGFFLWPSLEGPEISDKERLLLQEYRPSGIVLFRRNLVSLEQGRRLVGELKHLLRQDEGPYFFEPLIAIDEEGGKVARLPSPVPRGRPALSFFEQNDVQGLREQTLLQAIVAKALGINCILAPVADILTEPENPVMGDRCFGTDSASVSYFAEVVARTLLQEGVFPCAKHFPGHGNTRTDSHKEFAQSSADLPTLLVREWAPFEHLFKCGVSLCMTAHVVVPSVDPHKPATLSSIFLKDWLRKKLNFQGLILSDDLRMNAIAEYYGVKKSNQEADILDQKAMKNVQNSDDFLAKAALDAMDAGVDILLSCQSVVREKVILEALAQRLSTAEKNTDFVKSAARIVKILKQPLL